MNPTPSRSPVFGAAAVASLALVVSLVTSAVVVSNAYLRRGEQPLRHGSTLEVTGSARARIRSDLATWTIRAAGEGKTLQEAYQRVEASVEGVRRFLSAEGFPEGAAALGPIDTSTHFRLDEKGRPTREVLSYELSRRFRIESRDVEKVGKAAGLVTELLKTGAHVESGAPEFVYTGLADLKVRMVGEATANARERAETIAGKSGCRLGPVRDARAGVLQITRPWSTEVSSGGVSDTSTVEKDVTAVVHLTFMVDR